MIHATGAQNINSKMMGTPTMRNQFFSPDICSGWPGSATKKKMSSLHLREHKTWLMEVKLPGIHKYLGCAYSLFLSNFHAFHINRDHFVVWNTDWKSMVTR